MYSFQIYSTLITSVAMRKKNRRKMANRKGITSLDLLFKKSAQEITWEKKSSLLNLKIVTYILSFAVMEGAEDDQHADHHKYEGWKTPPIKLR